MRSPASLAFNGILYVRWPSSSFMDLLLHEGREPIAEFRPHRERVLHNVQRDGKGTDSERGRGFGPAFTVTCKCRDATLVSQYGVGCHHAVIVRVRVL